MNKIACFALTLTFICSSAALADTFSYTYISGSYSMFSEEIDGIPEDMEGDGIEVSGSINVAPNIAIMATYGTGSADVTSGGITVDADSNIAGVGVLFHTPINQTADFLAGINLIRGDVDIDVNGTFDSSEDANGNSIFLGLRAMATDNMELNGFVERVEIEDDSDNYINLGASYYINKLMALDASYSFNGDGNTISFGATKYF